MASGKRHERTRARRMALQVLYTGAITGESPTAIAESGRYLDEDGTLPEYALTLIRGCEAHKAGLGAKLDATADNWSLSRMPVVDQSILRIGAFEVLYSDDVPTSVAINEAVELAKAYGSEDDSPRFVNGVLGRIAKGLAQDAAEDAVAADEVAAEDAAEAAEATEAVVAGAADEVAAAVVCADEAADVAAGAAGGDADAAPAQDDAANGEASAHEG